MEPNLVQLDKLFAGSLETIRGELRYALAYLTANKLLESAKWHVSRNNNS